MKRFRRAVEVPPRTVVVPAGKGPDRAVRAAVQALLAGATYPVLLLDLYGVTSSDAVGGLSTEDGPGDLPLGDSDVEVHRLRVDDLLSRQDELDLAGEVLLLGEVARAQGRGLVLVGPLLLAPSWVYAGVVSDLADRLVVCMWDAGDDHGVWATEFALPLVVASYGSRVLVTHGAGGGLAVLEAEVDGVFRVQDGWPPPEPVRGLTMLHAEEEGLPLGLHPFRQETAEARHRVFEARARTFLELPSGPQAALALVEEAAHLLERVGMLQEAGGDVVTPLLGRLDGLEQDEAARQRLHRAALVFVAHQHPAALRVVELLR